MSSSAALCGQLYEAAYNFMGNLSSKSRGQLVEENFLNNTFSINNNPDSYFILDTIIQAIISIQYPTPYTAPPAKLLTLP